MRGIVGEERRGKETDGCPLTAMAATAASMYSSEGTIIG
jgi:hypothetical protein